MTKFLIFHFHILLFYFIGLTLPTTAVNSVRPHLIPCTTCCPSLFHSSQGVVNVRDSSYLVHSLSYQMRCLLSSEDVIIVSDTHLSDHFLFDIQNWDQNQGKDTAINERTVCTVTEHIPFALVSAKKFLSFEVGFLQKVIYASPSSTVASLEDLPMSGQPGKRVSFLIVGSSNSQMMSLIRRVDQELTLLKADNKLFWQPRIIFIWPEIQLTSRDAYHDMDQRNATKMQLSCERDVLNSWFENYQPKFSLDSGVFFLFLVQKGNSSRSQKNLYMSVWEGYHLKGDFILGRVTDHLYKNTKEGAKEETCSSVSRDERIISMEKINGYVFLELFRRRENFGRRPLVAATSDSSKWIQLKRNEDGSIVLQSGGSVNMYRDFQLMMNFSEEVVLGDRVYWGEYVRNDTSVTVTGQLNTGAVDISLNQETLTPTRGQASTVLQPTYFGTFHAFFLQPSDNSIRNLVTASFTRSVWISLLCAWCLIILCMNCWGYLVKRNRMLDSCRDLNFFQEAEMWSVAAICQKAWYISPKTRSVKIVFYVGSVMAFLLYAAYSATIVSFLTVQTVPIKSIDDLVEYRYRFSVHEQSQPSLLLAQKLVETYNFTQDVRRVNTEEEISHVLVPNNAFLAYPDLFYKTAEDQKYSQEFICTNISTVSVQHVPYKSSMSVKKGSQYHELFSAKLLKILERGLNFRYITIYENSRGYTCSKRNYDMDEAKDWDPVHLGDVLLVFLIIMIGWLVATALFFTERVLHLRRKYFYLV